ncbi:MAG: 2,3-bisphosphoglycerate-independent phosphoglycerate mutase, partial [Blastocatellia bacterium]
MNQKRGPIALVIIDGWGYSPTQDGNAIALASTPYYDDLTANYPMTLLAAHGTRVGLPDGVMGNSEVGHLNIGSGRVIRMDVSLVDHEIVTGEFFNNRVLVSAVENVVNNNRSLHLMGLLSDGQVHSSLEHLYALLRLAKKHGVKQVYIHCFLDGRDTPPTSGVGYLKALQRKMEEIEVGEIATVGGRYYAMDRDKRWERTKRAYDLLVHAEGEHETDAVTAVEKQYKRGITDEFIEPIALVRPNGEPVATIHDGDSVIFFNFRPDRARQLTKSLAIQGFNEFAIDDRPRVHFVCFTLYDSTFDLPIAFPPRQHRNVLAQVWGNICVRNYRLAETEKYAHVTY